MAWHRTRSKFHVHVDTDAVKQEEARLIALGVKKKEAAHAARLTVYAERSADGIVFASKKECHRYRELALLQRAGEISDLQMQVRFHLHVNGTEVAIYVCDFQYMKNGATTVEDSKGKITDVYLLKKKMLRAEYGIEIYET